MSSESYSPAQPAGSSAFIFVFGALLLFDIMQSSSSDGAHPRMSSYVMKRRLQLFQMQDGRDEANHMAIKKVVGLATLIDTGLSSVTCMIKSTVCHHGVGEVYCELLLLVGKVDASHKGELSVCKLQLRDLAFQRCRDVLKDDAPHPGRSRECFYGSRCSG